jgi:RNA polymerase sigma-70 factor (ECF subfamily)
VFLRFKRKNTAAASLPDDELLNLYRKDQNPEIIAILFQRYTHLVYGVCLKYLEDPDDAKDAVMEIFEGLIDSLLRHDIQNFKSWMHSVTRNHCLMKLRKEIPIPLSFNHSTENSRETFVENDEDSHPDDILEKFSPEELDKVLKTLKEPQLRCIELVYLQDKSYQEVCGMTGYSMNEVKSHVQNGKRNLKIRLEELNAKRS